ncbi:MAG TPA: linear amide C-N hydrolase [Desulfobacterales bacterium]|nr:linear amide C-N hydrolase [Desulfobacterales bacterium]
MILLRKAFCLLTVLSIFFIGNPAAHACSSFRVVTADGHVFFVFNFELGAKPATKVVFYPKNTDFSASAPEGRKGASWSSKYAVTGMGWFSQPMLAGGINEHGLACANLKRPT